MHQSYADITEQLGEPLWWDEIGVPRYCEFSPRQANNIYASEVVLYAVACQDCGREFKVASSLDRYAAAYTDSEGVVRTRRLADAIRARKLHYGDPPNIGCCLAGPTMNSVPLRVLEYWHRNSSGHFVRDRKLELGSIEPDWWTNELSDDGMQPSS